MMCGCKKFTLIELVTVIAIAALLTALIGAAFSSIGRGSNVNAAAAEIGNALNLARSQAASRRQYVAVILAKSEVEENANFPRKIQQRKFAAYRLAYVKKSQKGFDFVGWIPSSEWRTLPGTTILLAVQANLTAADAVPGAKPADNYTATVAVDEVVLGQEKEGNGQPVNITADMTGVVFSPKGTLVPAKTLRFTVADIAEWNGQSVVFENSDEDNTALNVKYILVNKYTGVVKYEDPQ